MLSKNDLWIKFLKANQKTMKFIYVKCDYYSDISKLSHTAYFRNCNRGLIADLYRFYHATH